MSTIFPQIMGILNVTPDSFSDGGKYFSADDAIRRACALADEGTDIIDIGGESTRPGAEEVPASEEIRRTAPVIEAIRKIYPNIEISIDTTKHETAAAAADAGATIINDISGMDFDERIGSICAERGLAICLMHIQGVPRTMQANPTYENVVREVKENLLEKIRRARSAGVRRIIADVGIGFGKSVEHNWELLRNYKEFSALGVPTLLGISRKSFIGKTFGIDVPAERDLITAFIHALMMSNPPDIVRVHNVSLLNSLREVHKRLA